jgi:hypothetical protein
MVTCPTVSVAAVDIERWRWQGRRARRNTICYAALEDSRCNSGAVGVSAYCGATAGCSKAKNKLTWEAKCGVALVSVRSELQPIRVGLASAY